MVGVFFACSPTGFVGFAWEGGVLGTAPGAVVVDIVVVIIVVIIAVIAGVIKAGARKAQ
jgi:hypothetical protein